MHINSSDFAQPAFPPRQREHGGNVVNSEIYPLPRCPHLHSSSTTPRRVPDELRLMLSGQPYLASDPYIQRIASTQRQKLHAIHDERDDAKRTALLKGFFNCEGVFASMGPIFAEYV
ncbi:hypothetical protein D9611_013133 [Ephemerocybe angulata]|uniref:Maltose/galactoside acetyltransferase domain-containing protein n=1 Tax=Ephemerocybe angulata TaxID=980116 RepID=A0A8H5BXV7_9AGAR|nr:hypothetical protein D9611_013133 [Tulosesus angulatus]